MPSKKLGNSLLLLSALLPVAGVLRVAAERIPLLAHLGKQPDGSFLVSSGQHIAPGTVAFDFRPIDMALHPSGQFFAVLNQSGVFLADRNGVFPDSNVPLGSGAAYRGARWNGDGTRLYVSVENGWVQELVLADRKMTMGRKIAVAPAGIKGNPRPGGLCITRDGTRLYAALCDRNAVAEIDLQSGRWLHEFPAQNLPFEVQLSADETTLLVSNWGGRLAVEGDEKSPSADALLVVDPRGACATGTVSLIDRASGDTRTVPVGLHPTAIVVNANRAYVANAASDTISVLDIAKGAVANTFAMKWGRQNLFGSMPCALAIHDNTLYVCNGGDNALAQLDLATGRVQGFRPAGYYPVQVALDTDGKTAYALNTKGNGSVRRTVKGQAGNAHDFQGTVSVLDLTADLKQATETVAANNHWNRDMAALHPNLAVYRGAIKHVLYIIKENRTYDEVFGGMKQGNGDASLCTLGRYTPNHQAIAGQFTLFDNGYVSGTNSADGHAWSTQALANDYLEHNYTGYRTYPDDGDDPMALSNAGGIWDAALKKGKSLRIYGEFADDDLATFTPKPKTWLDVWQDRFNRPHKINIAIDTRVAHIRKYMHPQYVYWPLLQSDQARADLFIEEYQKNSLADAVPNLMVMSLPCDHTEGRSPQYPKPQCMVADNDLALGRIVEAVSHSPQWKDTCIFVIEDDAQSGPDHVDGHRTVYMAISPYTKRKFVDSSLYTTVSMLRSIELMLGLDPMNKFDALTPPLAACFMDAPDLSPYASVPAAIPLDDMNPPLAALKGRERYWTEQSLALDWSGLDRPDPQKLNEVLWHTFKGADTPYPFPQKDGGK